MPGHFGTDTKTIRGLQVIAINEKKSLLTISGTVPGHRNSLLKITKAAKTTKT
jgi:large subunit ribosomal protein L3